MRPDSPLPGILTLGGLTIIILLIAWAASGCAEMPLTLSVHGGGGKASYSAKSGIEITIEK